MGFGEPHHLVGRHVAGDEQRRVLGAVVAAEKVLCVGVALGHLLDVREEAHRRVAVRVGRERRLALRLEQPLDRVGEVLVVLAQHRARLGAERVLGVRQVLEAVALDAHHLGQRVAEERRVVDRPVVGGVGVLVGPGLREDALVVGGGDRLGPAKHHVLEKVREAAAAGLDLVAAAGADDELERDDFGQAGRDDHHAQPVRQVAHDGLERERARGAGRGGRRRRGRW